MARDLRWRVRAHGKFPGAVHLRTCARAGAHLLHTYTRARLRSTTAQHPHPYTVQQQPRPGLPTLTTDTVRPADVLVLPHT